MCGCFFPWFLAATLQVMKLEIGFVRLTCVYFCRIVEAFLEQLVFWASKKKELNGFPYEGRCGEMFHKQPTNEPIENDYSGSFDVLSEISLLSFCIQPKKWIPFPIHVLVWPDSKAPLDGIC